MPVAPSLARVGRFLSSIFAPAAAIFGFSCLLTFLFVLDQPHPGPGELQQLGWQSWSLVSSESSTGVSSTHSGSTPEGGLEGAEEEDVAIDVPSPGSYPEGTDWWDTSPPDSGTPFDYASLPLDVWDPLMPHDTGCTFHLSHRLRYW